MSHVTSLNCYGDINVCIRSENFLILLQAGGYCMIVIIKVKRQNQTSPVHLSLLKWEVEDAARQTRLSVTMFDICCLVSPLTGCLCLRSDLSLISRLCLYWLAGLDQISCGFPSTAPALKSLQPGPVPVSPHHQQRTEHSQYTALNNTQLQYIAPLYYDYITLWWWWWWWWWWWRNTWRALTLSCTATTATVGPGQGRLVHQLRCEETYNHIRVTTSHHQPPATPGLAF